MGIRKSFHHGLGVPSAYRGASSVAPGVAGKPIPIAGVGASYGRWSPAGVGASYASPSIRFPAKVEAPGVGALSGHARGVAADAPGVGALPYGAGDGAA